MAINLPDARGLFINMQDPLHHMEGGNVVLTRGVHQALADFRWLEEYLIRRPTGLYELVPLQPMMDGCHDASGHMC